MNRKLSSYQHRLVRRITAILNFLGPPDHQCRLTDIAAAVELDTGTTYRLLSELVREGYVYKDARTRAYSIGYEVFRLGESACARSVTAERSREHLARLAAETNATIVLASREGREVYLHKMVLPSREAKQSLDPAHRPFVDAHATAVGKVLLAFSHAEEIDALYRGVALHRHTARTINDKGRLIAELQRVREQGHATERGEHAPCHHAIGVPIFSPVGRVNLALWLIGSARGFATLSSPSTVTRVKQTAARLIQDVTGRPSLAWSAKLPAAMPPVKAVPGIMEPALNHGHRHVERRRPC